MLNRYIVVLLLCSLLFGCNGENDNGEETRPIVTDEASDHQEEEKQSVRQDSTVTESTQDDLTFNEIQKNLQLYEVFMDFIGFTFVENEKEMALEVQTDSKFHRHYYMREGSYILTENMKFDLISGREYCLYKDMMVTERGEISTCRDKIFKRHERLINTLIKIQYFERLLLEKYSNRLSKEEEVRHLGKLKLAIQIKEVTKRFDRFIHERLKFKDNEWGGVQKSISPEELENVIVISNYKKTPYHVHLMASKNSPELEELAEKGKIRFLGDLEKGIAYDQQVRIYKTSLFTYVKLIDSKS